MRLVFVFICVKALDNIPAEPHLTAVGLVTIRHQTTNGTMTNIVFTWFTAHGQVTGRHLVRKNPLRIAEQLREGESSGAATGAAALAESSSRKAKPARVSRNVTHDNFKGVFHNF